MLQSFLKNLNLNVNEAVRIDCPICFHNKTFSALNTGEKIVYNCFHADCNIKGRTRSELSKRLFNEMKTFIWNNGKPQAMKKHNDDLILACAIGCWVKETALAVNQRSVEYQKAFLSSIIELGHIGIVLLMPYFLKGPDFPGFCTSE